MSGYILDDLALIAGLTNQDEEHHHRELSRLLIAAIHGGPSIAVPALCLTAATTHRAAIAEHLAGLVTGGPAGAITITGLTRTAEVAQLRAEHRLSWAALHATAAATAARAPIVTIDPGRYTTTVVEAISL